MVLNNKPSGRIVNLVLLISFILFYLALNILIDLILFSKIIIILGLVFVYIILAILISRYFGRAINSERIIIKKKRPLKEYLGSTESNTYHKKECRFSGMIKPEYLLGSDNNEFFKKKKFKACKNCKPNRD